MWTNAAASLTTTSAPCCRTWDLSPPLPSIPTPRIPPADSGTRRNGTHPGKDDPLYARVFLETQNWSELIGCHNLEELNRAIDTGRIYDLVATAEALQEKKMAELADTICRQKPSIRLVCMAGPSSSGKTTFMKRLIVHLWVNGVRPVMLSLDDYFRNRDEMGNENWENLGSPGPHPL